MVGMKDILRSSKQRYRLTERGLALLAEHKNNEPST